MKEYRNKCLTTQLQHTLLEREQLHFHTFSEGEQWASNKPGARKATKLIIYWDSDGLPWKPTWNSSGQHQWSGQQRDVYSHSPFSILLLQCVKNNQTIMSWNIHTLRSWNVNVASSLLNELGFLWAQNFASCVSLRNLTAPSSQDFRGYIIYIITCHFFNRVCRPVKFRRLLISISIMCLNVCILLHWSMTSKENVSRSVHTTVTLTEIATSMVPSRPRSIHTR